MYSSVFKCDSPVTSGVYTALAARDVAVAYRFMCMYQEPDSMFTNIHLSAVNKFWRDQLSYASNVCDTLQARSYLIDNVQLHDWLRMFAQFVAPVIIELDLPQALPEPSATIFNFAPLFA